jgi:anaerobic selenocysteine-containing dehydrogenase
LTIIKTVCHRDCPDTCFVDAIVENGKLVSTKGSKENPITQGFLCPRGIGDPKRVYSKERVLFPHIRQNGDKQDSFAKVSWNDAIKLLTSKLNETIQKHGRESVLLYDYAGNQGLLTWFYPQRLWNALGVTKTDYALCSSSGHEGINLHYGLAYGFQPEDVKDIEVITYWGNNAKVSSPHQWNLSQKIQKEKGTTIISIDPRKSETSKAADLWISPRPGSDVALTYGIAKWLIENDCIDGNFINQWTKGFELYKKEVVSWTPERIKQITGLDWKKIEELGEIYNKKRPGVFQIGLGLQKSSHGAEAARAVSLLPSLLGLHRGFHYSDGRGRFIDWDYLTGSGLTKLDSKIVHQVDIGSHLESGEFKFVFVYCTNPASTLPNLNAVRAGLSRDDVFLVVHDTHWTETTRYADVVLPAATYFEKTDVNFSDHHLYCRLSNKVINPLEGSKDEIYLMNEIIRELELDTDWLLEDPWKVLRKSLKNSFQNGTLDDLLEGKELKLRLKPMNEYQTQSGKIEFYASKAEKLGFNPLPEQLPCEPEEGMFVLLNSSISKYTHSQFRDVYGPIPQHVWLNSKDAASLNIKNNDRIKIYNDLGGVVIHTVVTNDTPQGVLWAPRPLTGLEDNPLNILADSKPQVIGGGPRFNSIKVRIERLG